MPLVIGLDEAGYGPNLGPLVIGTTVWETPPGCDADALWDLLAEVVDPTGEDSARLQVADSKDVHRVDDLSALELPVLAVLESCGIKAAGFQSLWRLLSPDRSFAANDEPWLEDADLALPFAADAAAIADTARQFQRAKTAAGLKIATIAADVVQTARFNRLLERNDTKGQVLSRATLQLLADVWPGEEVHVIADKHGGRDRYDSLLAEELGATTNDALVLKATEGRAVSRYRISRSVIEFRKGAESFLPVALASMVAKYLRELAIELFNRFWLARVPDVRPTKGYPVDAQRFRRDVESTRKHLGIAESVFWRAK